MSLIGSGIEHLVPVGGAVWEGSGGIDLLEEICHYGVGSEIT